MYKYIRTHNRTNKCTPTQQWHTHTSNTLISQYIFRFYSVMKRFAAFEYFCNAPDSRCSPSKMRFPCTRIDVTWDWWWGMLCALFLQWLLLFREISYIRWLMMGPGKKRRFHQNDSSTINYEPMCKRWRWTWRKMRGMSKSKTRIDTLCSTWKRCLNGRNIVFGLCGCVCVIFVAIVLKCIRKVLNRITNISAPSTKASHTQREKEIITGHRSSA